MRELVFDRNDEPVTIGDRVRILTIPASLPAGLPIEDQLAIKAQLGKLLVVESIREAGELELEFFDADGNPHTIWLEGRCVEKI